MTSTDLPLITPTWSAPERVIAYSTTRHGGVSCGNYDAMNVGLHVGDDPANVQQNRSLLPYSDKIQWLEQTHSDSVADLQTRHDQPVSADAAYTNVAGVFCAVMTADCVPILVCSEQGDEVAAIHAGWRGLTVDIIAKTIRRFSSPVSRLTAWVGPCISSQHYEVDDKVHKHFTRYQSAYQPLNNGKYLLDLKKIAHIQLRDCGISAISVSPYCTYADSNMLFSHRRSSRRENGPCGRQVSVIGFI